MTEDWRNSVDNKEAVAAVAVDLGKAFDAINPPPFARKVKGLWLFSTCFATDVYLPARSPTTGPFIRGKIRRERSVQTAHFV